MRVTTSITSDDFAGIGERAVALEAKGFDQLSSQENRHDPFVPLTLAAATTSTIGLATNVAISFPRSPMMAASVAWDLQALSGGRFTLGLGTQIRAHNERRFSTPWSKPAARMREYVQAIKAIFACWEHGERLDYRGDHYTFTLMTPNFTPPALESAPPPVHLAAVGPMMLTVAATEADGVALHGFCTPDYLREVIMPRLDDGLATSGRTRADFSISGGGFIATGETDEEVANAAEWVRQRIGFYGSTPAYWPVLEQHDLGDLGRKLNAMSKAGQWDDMTKEIDDDTVALFCAVGRWDEIAGRVQEHFGDLVDVVGLDAGVPPGLIEDFHAMP